MQNGAVILPLSPTPLQPVEEGEGSPVFSDSFFPQTVVMNNLIIVSLQSTL
jgi:hypothetical protein